MNSPQITLSLPRETASFTFCFIILEIEYNEKDIDTLVNELQSIA
jgi:hypothetical protein